MNRRERRQKRLERLGIVFGVLLVGILAFQAIYKLVRNDLSPGRNYYEQPVGPVLQLIIVVVAIVVALLYGYKRFHRKNASNRKNDQETPAYKPPNQWPWD